nr:MAG TPA: hypothetical protein [Caudoviricetes sp.]
MVLLYEQEGTTIRIKAGTGDLVLENANKVGNMIYGDLHGEYIQMCLTPEPDGFFYGIWKDGSRLQVIGTEV